MYTLNLISSRVTHNLHMCVSACACACACVCLRCARVNVHVCLRLSVMALVVSRRVESLCVCIKMHLLIWLFELDNAPKNGLIALLLTTNGLMCSKYVSQERNEAIGNCQSYKMILNFIL